MPGPAQNTDQEYWRPDRLQAPISLRTQSELCERCGTEYVMGARFCHVCGAERGFHPKRRVYEIPEWLDFQVIKKTLGLTTAPTIAFFIGVACILGAVFTGFFYSSATLPEWQAVQTWRLEWMLAAVAAFVAGILLKSSRP